MIKILTFLQGKKGVIASIIGCLIAYLAAKGYIAEAEIALLCGIQAALFGIASKATYTYLNK